MAVGPSDTLCVAVLAPFGEVVERLLQIEQSEQASSQTWTLGYGTLALPNVPGLPGNGAPCCRSCATCLSGFTAHTLFLKQLWVCLDGRGDGYHRPKP